MSDRRSSRPRKNVDYSKFASVNTDCDDEDDFVDDSTPPPPQKRTKKETKSRSKKDAPLKIIDTADKGKRRSLDEKLYTRDLQLALKKSTANENALKSSNSDASKSHNEPLAVSGCESARPNDGNCHSATARLQPPSIIGQSGPPQVTAAMKGDEKRRQAAATATQKITEGCPQDQDEQTSNNDDEEYQVEKEVASDVSSSGDEDFEESDDEGSDFEETHKSPPRKKTSERSAIKVKITQSVEGKTVKKSLHASVNGKSNFPARSKVRQSTDDSQVTTTQPAAKKPVPQLSATSSRSPFSGSGLRSPCGSTLRLGLSRRVHVKPLHAMAKNMQQT